MLRAEGSPDRNIFVAASAQAQHLFNGRKTSYPFGHCDLLISADM